MTSLPPAMALALSLVLIVGVARRWASPANKGPSSSCGDTRGLALLLLLGVPFIASAEAAVLSMKNELFRPQCLITMSPCIIVVIAFAISSLSTWPRLMGALLASIFLLGSLAESSRIKSNTRELAEMVAARAEPSDLVVVTPCWFASTFSYYYKGDNPQCTYPDDSTVGPIPYDGMKRRFLDPEPVRQFRETLNQAYLAGRRVWLVSRNENRPTPRFPLESDEAPAEYQGLHYLDLGDSRASQISEIVKSRYGNPEFVICPRCDREGIEVLRASLYGKSQLGGKRALSALAH